MQATFVFRRDGVEPELPRLADAVARAHAPVDVGTLAGRVLFCSPLVAGRTVYRGITAIPNPQRGNEASAAGSPPASPRHAAQLLRQTIEHAMDRALRGVTRVAVATGGGLDSAALLALASAWAERTGGTAFGVALDFESLGDDRPHLQALQARLGCEIVRVRPEAAAHRSELVERGIDAAPLTWPSGVMEIELLAQARAAGAEVVLSGAGADELFDGDPRSLAALMRAGRISGAVCNSRELRGFDRPRSSVASWLVRPLLASVIPIGVRRRRARRREPSMPRWAGPRLERVVKTWHAIELERTLALPPVPEPQRGPSEPSSHHEQLLWLRHQQEVAAGLERRDPYLDAELITFVRSLPPHWLLTGGRRRGLFREAMQGLLPESLRLRDDKAAFEPALARFVAAIGGEGRLRPLSDVRCLADLGIVSPAAFAEDYRTFVSSLETTDAWATVWPALTVEAFLRSRAESWS